jgi:hypothetical protein
MMKVWVNRTTVCVAFLVLLIGCGENPLDVLGLNKPTELVHLQTYLGVTGNMYGGFLSGSRGHISTERHLSFAVNMSGTYILLSFPASMFTFDFKSDVPNVTMYGSGLYGTCYREKIKRAPGRVVSERRKDGQFTNVTAIHISLPASLKPDNSFKLW